MLKKCRQINSWNLKKKPKFYKESEKNPIKIGFIIKKICWNTHKRDFIRNIKQKINWINNKWFTYKNRQHRFWHLVACFCSAFLLRKSHKLCRGPFVEHLYHCWSQPAKWFQRRRLKCKSLRTTTHEDD